MKVLVADDSEVMRTIIHGVLFLAGITDIVEAANGQEAVEIVMSQDLDLVLMDWEMPVMPGIIALREIRAAGSRVPLIMMVLESEKSWEAEAIKGGATNCIIKPFKPETISAKIQEICGMVW